MPRIPEAPPTPPPRPATLSPLLAAAYFGNVEELMDGLREGEDLEAQDPSDGCRPLHAAILTEQTEAASYLIRQRADLESRAFEGLTPLLLACRSDAGRLVRLLLRHSADVTARDASGRSAQDICAEHRSKSAAKALAGEEEPELAEPQDQEESAESTERKEQSIAEVRQNDGSTPDTGDTGKGPVRLALGLGSLFALSALSAAQEAPWAASKQCPERYDSNGMWKGSRLVGGNYTLYCAPGFEVSGPNGGPSRSLTCPPSLVWLEELHCKNVDDCAKLRHGCGALGICLDLIDGYDCNCENGFYTRHYLDGEIVCGPKGIDKDVCHGHTCGAYGVCIDLVGNASGYDSAKGVYRCECTDGFFDNGVTCERQDCGNKSDPLGTWLGSTKFGDEYTLRCPPGSYIWGGALQEVTMSCGASGQWLSDYWCVNPLDKEAQSRMATMELWLDIASVLLCMVSAALAAGLTLGLATVEPFGLRVILAARPEDCTSPEERAKLKSEQDYAVRILPLVREHHLLLVTLLLFNTVANEALPVFLDRLLPSWAAVLLSVSVVLICGEILPSAVFTGPNQFAIASALVPLVQVLQVLFFPVARPIANVLDQMFKDEASEEGGEGHGGGGPKYSRAELRAMCEGPEADKESESNGHFCNCAGSAPQLQRRSPRTEEVGGGPETLKTELQQAAAVCLQDVEDEVIAKSELRMLDGAGALEGWTKRKVLSLRDRYLSQLRCFTPLKHCRIASAKEQAVDVVARCALNGGDRCVIVLHDGSTAVLGAPPSFDTKRSCRFTYHEIQGEHGRGFDVTRLFKESLICDTVLMKNCQAQDRMLKGGTQKLSALCPALAVTVDEDDHLMQVMGKLRSQNSSSAIVAAGSDTVRGVVHVSQVVSFLMTAKDFSREGTKEMWSPSVSPGFRPTNNAQRRHPLARARCRIDASMRERERERDTLL
ncbi:CBSDUF7 [Symbiodinium microadriaticum]|nr:CBSDUF7 [Symbiodinium microadriaticum]